MDQISKNMIPKISGFLSFFNYFQSNNLTASLGTQFLVNFILLNLHESSIISPLSRDTQEI